MAPGDRRETTVPFLDEGKTKDPPITGLAEYEAIPRMARVKTAVLRDGVLYEPNSDRDRVPVDKKTYLDLLEVDAIIRAEPWEALELASEKELPAALTSDGRVHEAPPPSEPTYLIRNAVDL